MRSQKGYHRISKDNGLAVDLETKKGIRETIALLEEKENGIYKGKKARFEGDIIYPMQTYVCIILQKLVKIVAMP